jgi:hypothetical protein
MPQRIVNFKALAHPIRFRILDCLRDGEKGVNELSKSSADRTSERLSAACDPVRAQRCARPEIGQQRVLVGFRPDALQTARCSKGHFHQSSRRRTGHVAADKGSLLETKLFCVPYIRMYSYVPLSSCLESGLRIQVHTAARHEYMKRTVVGQRISAKEAKELAALGYETGSRGAVPKKAFSTPFETNPEWI